LQNEIHKENDILASRFKEEFEDSITDISKDILGPLNDVVETVNILVKCNYCVVIYFTIYFKLIMH